MKKKTTALFLLLALLMTIMAAPVLANESDCIQDPNTPGFWGNKNGAAVLEGSDWEILLAGYNLVDENGAAFDPDNFAEFRTWLRGGNATNMSYMLSVQLAAMVLNIEYGYVVEPEALNLPYGDDLINLVDLIDESDEALGADPTGDDKEYLEMLKNSLDWGNNYPDSLYW